MEDEQFPIVDPALVKKLEDIYKDECPNVLHYSEAELGMLFGQIDVVRMLRRKMEEQQENILTGRG